MLNQLQAKLCKDLDELAHVFAESFKDRVGISVIAMGKLLFEVKGGGHGSRPLPPPAPPRFGYRLLMAALRGRQRT